MRRDRVAIVYPSSNLDTVPSLCNAAILLSQHGYMVDFFTYVSPEFMAPSFDGFSGINLRVSHQQSYINESPQGITSLLRAGQARLQKRGIRLTWLRECYRLLRRFHGACARWKNWLLTLARSVLVWWQHRRIPFRCFIGVDPEGLLEAYSLTRFIRVPLVYYSLELLFWDEINSIVQERLKKQEICLSRQSSFVVIQDQERARLLAQENEIPLKKFVLVPNAPLGPTRHESSGYWHEQLKLSPGVRIVLHAGSLWQWTGVGQIADSAKSWPANWVLVVHSRYDAQRSKDIERLRELAASGRIFLSLKPVARQEYDTLVDGANIGIAFYMPIGFSTTTRRNTQAVGLSSGKIAYYLRAGLPVIVNQGASISELVQRQGCGVSVQDPRDIGNAIVQITQDYQSYSQRAHETFDRHFNVAHTFEEVIRRIDSLDQ